MASLCIWSCGYDYGSNYHISQTIVPPECTHSEPGGTILHKKIKLLKVGFPIPSKNVLIVHIEKNPKMLTPPHSSCPHFISMFSYG